MDQLPEKVAQLMSKCIGCGLCDDVCPSHKYGGCSPQKIMNGEDSDATLCIGCGKCSDTCGNTDPLYVMKYMHRQALNAAIPDTFYKTGFVAPVFDHPSRQELPYVPSGDDVYLMAGCTVECSIPYLKYAGGAALNAVGISNSDLPNATCCTLPVPFRSITDEERHKIKKKMDSGREIITLCPGCSEELALSGIKAKHISNVFYENLDKLPKGLDLKIAIEPGCALETCMHEFEEIVRTVGATPLGNKTGCCGKSVKGVAEKLMSERQKEIKSADAVVVGCPLCAYKYDKVPGGTPVLHISELVALAAGDKSTLKYHSNKLQL